jgi:hypothetical protein
VTAKRSCAVTNQGGHPCGQPPGRESDFCFWHDPAMAEEAAAARRLGGTRRKRDATVKGAYEIEGLTTIPEIRRVVEIAVLDALSLENSVARSRALMNGAQVLVKLVEVGEFEDRLAQLESVMEPRLKKGGRR